MGEGPLPAGGGEMVLRRAPKSGILSLLLVDLKAEPDEDLPPLPVGVGALGLLSAWGVLEMSALVLLSSEAPWEAPVAWDGS